jgi:hypothetical protein
VKLSQHPIQWLLGARSPGVKRQGREAALQPPSSAHVKNGGAKHPLPICLHGIVLNQLSTATILPSFLPSKFSDQCIFPSTIDCDEVQFVRYNLKDSPFAVFVAFSKL